MSRPFPSNAMSILQQRVAKLDGDLLPMQRAWHFSTARLTQQRVLDELAHELNASFRAGEVEGQWRMRAHDVLRKYKMVTEPFEDKVAWAAYQNDVKNLDSLARLRLIHRVNVSAAYGLTTFQNGFKPNILRQFPCWRFDRISGAKDPRALHVEFEGEVRLKWDWDFWAFEMNAARIGGFELPWAPFGFNSFMTLSPVPLMNCPPEFQSIARDMTKYTWQQIVDECDSYFGTSLSKLYAKCKGPFSVKDLDEVTKAKFRRLLAEQKLKLAALPPEATGLPMEAIKVDVSPKISFEPSTSRAAALRNTHKLLEGRDGEVRWGRDVSKLVIDEYNETLRDLLTRYPINTLKKLGSYWSRSLSVGAKANHAFLRLNHDQSVGGLFRFPMWRPYDLIQRRADMQHARDQLAQIYREGHAKGWRVDRKPKGLVEPWLWERWRREALWMRDDLACRKRERYYSRHNVGVTEQGISVADIVTHEYGHAMHYNAMLKTGSIDADAMVRAEFLRAKSNDIFSISKYASTDEMEFFAEAFTAFERGEYLPDYIIDMIKRLIKQSQLQP